MSNTSTLNRQKQPNSVDGGESKEDDLATLKEIGKCIETCRGMYYHRLLSSVTRHSYEGMFEEVVRERRLDWAESNIGFLDKTIAKAESEERNMIDQLEREKSGRFNERDMRELHEWFQDDSLPEMTRSKLLDQKVSQFVAKFDAMARKRLALLSRLEELSDQDAQDLATLRSPEAFFSMDASARKNMMDRMEALDMASVKGKKKLYSDTKTLLDEAADGEDRYLSPTVSGTMLRQMIASDKPEQHHKETLLPSLRTYKDTRVSFDALVMELSGSDDAPIQTPSIDAFVKWNTGKRTSFIAEGHRRLNMQADEKESADEELALLKKLTEKYMRLEDWKGAEAFLEDAQARFPEDKDLTVMRRYLDNHRTDLHAEQKEEDMERISEEIDVMITKVSPEMRTIYIAMAMQGPDAFRAFAESMERGAFQKKKDESQDAPDDEVGSTVTQDIPGDQGDTEEIRDTNITVAGETHEDQMEAVKKVTDDGEAEKTLKFSRISAEIQERHARNISQPLLEKLYDLQDKGGNYGKAA